MTSPKVKEDIISIIVVNKTLDKIIAQIRDKQKVLRRFTLKREGKEVIQVKATHISGLSFVPIAPAFEEVELNFKAEPYEIPQKK